VNISPRTLRNPSRRNHGPKTPGYPPALQLEGNAHSRLGCERDTDGRTGSEKVA
jgi:hypothetical protein